MKRAIVIAMLMAVSAWGGEDVVGQGVIVRGDVSHKTAPTLSDVVITLSDMAYYSYANGVGTNVLVSAEQRVKELAESGEICKVYGHRWREGYYDDINPMIIHIRKEGLEICRICKAKKVTKTVTEIIPAVKK